MFVCPYCYKQVKRLKDHLKRVHPNETGTPKATPAPKATHKGKPFEVKVVKESKPKMAYKCGACGAALDGEISPCPSCGAELNWS